MKIRLSHILLVLLTCSGIIDASAQQTAPVNAEDDRMMVAYTFYLRQKMSLEFISGRFPSLKEYVENTMKEWNREFIPSVNNIDSALTSKLNDEWLKNKNAMYEKNIRADYSRISQEEAKQFVDVVNDRTYGRIQSPILETFLIWHPRYQKFPDKEFTDGYVNTFSTKDQRNPLPINLKIVYPRSWKALEGNKKANIVQTFVSSYGLGDVDLMLIIEKTKTNYTKEKITQLLSKESLQKSLPSNEKEMDYKPDISVDNCTAASMTSYLEKVVELKKVCAISERYSIYYKNFHIWLNFNVSSLNMDDIQEKFKKHQPLFKRIVDNMVILSQWGQ